MNQLKLEKALPADIPTLTTICIRSFHSDTEVGAAEAGGPPFYDSPKEHMNLLNQSRGYFKLMLDGKIIGGSVVFSKNPNLYYLGTIYIDPDYLNQGWGLKAMEMLFSRFDDAREWHLDTPLWNKRTRQFYEKLGFTETSRDNDFVYYRKIC